MVRNTKDVNEPTLESIPEETTVKPETDLPNSRNSRRVSYLWDNEGPAAEDEELCMMEM